MLEDLYEEFLDEGLSEEEALEIKPPQYIISLKETD